MADGKVIEAHRHSSYNRRIVRRSKKCGCFHCLQTFEPTKIHSWCDNGETALCPYCGEDSVLGELSGYPITKEFLTAMNDRWFLFTGTNLDIH